MKSDFINSITHEFNTPIATIMVANRNLQNEKALQSRERIAELTDIINRQSKRLKGLFEQVLDISRVNSDFERTEIVFCHFLDEVIQDYRIKVTEETVAFYTEGIDLNCRVSMNKFWVTTMLLNIFDNAIKYNDQTKKTIYVNISYAQNSLSVQIKDNGIGMGSHTVKHLFDKFYRDNTPGREHISGLGLGMYYVQQCIQIHNWEMEVHTTPGAGSEFVIKIPCVV